MLVPGKALAIVLGLHRGPSSSFLSDWRVAILLQKLLPLRVCLRHGTARPHGLLLALTAMHARAGGRHPWQGHCPHVSWTTGLEQSSSGHLTCWRRLRSRTPHHNPHATLGRWVPKLPQGPSIHRAPILVTPGGPLGVPTGHGPHRHARGSRRADRSQLHVTELLCARS